MTISPKQYVPVLRWRAGEYRALSKLSVACKSLVVPLIEVLEPDFDFEKLRPVKTIDKQLLDFGAQLQKSWGQHPALLDGRQLLTATRMADGSHPMTFLFNAARAQGAVLTPVIALSSDLDYQIAVRDIAAQDMNGVVLRCTLDEALDPDFAVNVAFLLGMIAIAPPQLDIVLDLRSPSYEPQAALIAIIRSALASPTFLGARSSVVLGASFPETLTALTLPIQTIDRLEWRLYKTLITALTAQERRPAFGDYAVAAIDFPRGDMRFMRGSPNIRYTVRDGWLVARTKRLKGQTNHAYPSLCQSIITSGQYRGPTFSQGSAYISGCHAGTETRGNATTWKWVATNHHITVVVDDLSRIP
nr:beta family protein [Brevundimonas pishanensis]